MATLSIRPRRTKNNPFPRSVGPLARWRLEAIHMALRADGSVVRRYGGGGWNVVTMKGKPRKGMTVEEVHEILTAAGYSREEV